MHRAPRNPETADNFECHLKSMPRVPHSIQGLGPDGCKFLLVFDDGNFDEFHTFLITDWLAHTQKEVLAKNLNVPPSAFDKVSKKELFIFQAPARGFESGTGAGSPG